MYERLSPASRRLLAALLVALAALALLGFAATSTVRANLADEGYYRDVLDENDVYDRLYRDLSRDRGFARQVDQLMGGVDVSAKDLVATLEEVVDPDDLREAVETAIERLVAYIRGEEDLDLSLDITPFVEAIYGVAIDYAVKAIVALPSNEVSSYEEFEAELANLLDLLSGEGALPEGIPSYPIPPDRWEEVALIIIEAAVLDLDSADGLEAAEAIAGAVIGGEVDLAIRLATASLLDQLIAASVEALTENDYVHTVERRGQVRYILEPPGSVTAKLEDRLAPVRTIDGAASWGRPLALVLLVAAVVAVGALYLPRRALALRWAGIALAAAGAITALAWLAARNPVSDRIIDVIIRRATILPDSFQEIVRDVVDTATGDLSPQVFGPALAAFVAGALAVVVSLLPRLKRDAGGG